MPVYTQPILELFHQLKSSANGLNRDEVYQLQRQYGLNILQEKKKMPAWLLFLDQFRDFMILILAVAAALSGLMGDQTDMFIIFVIILLNATVGFVQAYRAGKAMDALKKMAITQTQVIRDGHPVTVSSTDLVPGDIVLLESGNVVPADLRLLDAFSLSIDESSLTGESLPAEKVSKELADAELPLGDQLNMAFKGSLVTGGRGRGLVIATGMSTELGRIAGMLQGEEPATPLQVRMKRFGRNLSYLILGICLLLFISGVLRGEDPYRIFLLSVSLAVAAIPEALPALITIALSRGATRLARQHVLAKKLPAVETLGSVSFICSDKTGTLTQNRMKVVQQYPHPGAGEVKGLSMLELGMLLNHDIRFNQQDQPLGEPTELAIVEKVMEAVSPSGLHQWMDRYARVAELPFDSDRKCMSTLHHFQDRYLVVTKGAAEQLAAKLKDPESAQTLLKLTDEWAGRGIRVLAYGYRLLDELILPFDYDGVEKDLQWSGLVGLIDPPREEVKAAISECRMAGITPVMITGDHPATAKAIAREIGILRDGGLVLTGAELKQLDESDFLQRVEQVAVYARVSPDQKLRIVQALQQKGHFAAMTGDGVNDAPSLRAANIGIAMGINGTDVSKEAAHLILLDDHFATIVAAVREGRRIFDNIRRFVKYIMTCNGAEIWTIFLAPLMGLPIPLLPIHILWINLVTDGLPALALASEKAEPDVMQRPPRPSGESMFSDGLGYHIIWVGLLMAGVTLGTQAWAIDQQMEHWQTMVFTVLALSQLGHVFGIRSERSFLWQQGLFSNRPLLGSVLLTFALQMSVIYLPFMNTIFKTQPLTLRELGICIGLSLVVFHAVELEKWLKRLFIKAS